MEAGADNQDLCLVHYRAVVLLISAVCYLQGASSAAALQGLSETNAFPFHTQNNQHHRMP
jgi:hypothetical protein